MMKNEKSSSGFKSKYQDHLLTENEVAELARVSLATVRYWRQVGTLPSVKVGRHPRIWFSVFKKVFQMPPSNAPLESAITSDKIPSVEDRQRRKSNVTS